MSKFTVRIFWLDGMISNHPKNSATLLRIAENLNLIQRIEILENAK